MASIGDPVASGFVSNLSRPGGNITGLAFLSSEIAAKRLQVIKEIMPKVTHVALLFDDSAQRNLRPVLQNAATRMNVTVDFVAITSADQLDVIFGRMSREGVGAVMVQETPLLISKAKAIGATASRHRIASIGFLEVAEGGGLIAYGANIPDMWRRSATYIDKILKGAKPADMPIEQATKFELLINLKTAKALGITVPQSLLVSADKVIE
jgi:putative ABC transport system substrate-binding protein